MLIDNRYNNQIIALQNLATQLTGISREMVERMSGNEILRYISENLKPFVTREEIQAMFDAAVNKIIKELKGTD